MADVIVHKKSFSCRYFQGLQDISKNAGITFGFAQMEAVKDCMKILEEVILVIQLIKPVRLVALNSS